MALSMDAGGSRFSVGRKLLSGMASVLPWSLMGLALAFYAFPSSKAINNWFYTTVALPALILVFALPYRRVLASNLIAWSGVFAICLIGSTVLNLNPEFSASDHLKPILYTAMFLAAFLIGHERQPNLNRMITNVVIVVAFLAAIYTIYDFYEPRNWNWSPRLSGFGGISNPIWISGIYAVAALLSISRFMAGKNWTSYGYIALALPALAVMWLSQSRAPMVGWVAAMVALCVLYRNRRSFAAVSIAVAVLAGVAVYLMQTDFSSRYMTLPEHRFTIWGNALTKYLEAPVLGHGLHVDTTNISKHLSMQHYHNVYLTVAVQGGGLSLLVLLAFAAATLKAKVSEDTLPFKAVLVLGLVYMLSNGGSLFTSPKELWLLFWMPIAAIWASNRALSQER